MKRHIISAFLLLTMMLMLVGCGLLSKPEDAVDEFMTQDSLMEVISRLDDYSADDEADYSSKFWGSILTTPSVKPLLLENVRSISYGITEVSRSRDSATVAAVITHLDATPITDFAAEVFIEKLEEMDKAGVEAPENEDEILELILNVASQALKEAIAKAKPNETYTKVRFDCIKTSGGYWVLREIPDDFIEKVLLLNLPTVIAESVKGIEALG